MSEDLAELVAGPLNTVEGLLREHLQGAVRDLGVIFRVVLAAIGFGLVREHYLNVALGSKGSTF